MLEGPWKKYAQSSRNLSSDFELEEELELQGATCLELKGALVNVADQWGINKLLFEKQRENVSHLIYGEGYDGVSTRVGMPSELVFLLGKTPNLNTLEFRGFWDFTNIPPLTDYLKHFPKLTHLTNLVLPKEGKCLEKMGNILMGMYGSHLKSLECPSEFLEATAPDGITKSIPNLQHLKIFNTTFGLANRLPEFDWKLETLELGPIRGEKTELDRQFELCHGIPMPMLKKIILKFGNDLVKFNYAFPVTVEKEEMAEMAEYEELLKKFASSSNYST